MERGTLKQLEDLLDHKFSDENLLRHAVTHGSHLTAKHGSYERLEFLGDRVLGLEIAKTLWAKFPKENEGHLSRRFVDLVRKETLAQIGLDLGVDKFIRMSRAEEQSGGRKNPSVVSDVIEALLAALYLDAGNDKVAAFITKHWATYIDQKKRPPRDPKTALQEWAQGQGKPLPTYVELERTGPSHSPMFVMQVVVEGFEPVSASGGSKRKAEMAAAEKILAIHAPNIPTMSLLESKA